ncbi:hypothetical protein HYC85_001379 [Camellia sinensis]|uniref:Uncharacterized protein n=1 Tax=Camellia sinensis TaxID=4442 RepID=A0A7J7I5A1_CAMSI|nr:hypothetical protein HYC85_001379 [Camellia sinensis]
MKQKIEQNPPRSAREGDDNTRSTMGSSRKSSIRFLGVLKQPDSDPNPFELHESDVVWSSSDSTDLHSHSPPTPSNSPPNLLHQFHTEKSGLSAALSDDHHPLVRRKPALNPSLSAARTILPLRSEVSTGSPAPRKFRQSAPVNVPIWPKKVGVTNLRRLDEVSEEEEEMVPPHVMVARSHVMTFSVFEGVGRTLKGRDLRRVRNAVFLKTACWYTFIFIFLKFELVRSFMISQVLFCSEEAHANWRMILGKIDVGSIHNPSPQIKPDATAGIIKLAFLLLSLCHANTIKLSHTYRLQKPTTKLQAMLGQGREAFNAYNCHVSVYDCVMCFVFPIRVPNIESRVEEKKNVRRDTTQPMAVPMAWLRSID